MIQIYSDGVLAYDNRLNQPGMDYTILGLTTTTGENKGGTASIILPPNHPAYNLFVAHKSIVTMYRDGKLRFRGRALYPTDDMFRRRTWVIEGELCLLLDGLSRPYLYLDTPAAIFASIIEDYNAQVDEYKRFAVGEVTVTDANDYVRLESTTAEQSYDTLMKLVERCGGVIVFTEGDNGERVINWYADPGYRSHQAIEFGENLLDFSLTGANTDLATVIVPYGAQLDDGTRVTIAEVNDGKDYIEDAEAVALRGRIVKPVFYDDVTLPTNLLRKAQQDLELRRHVVTSLSLTALDLSRMDKNIDDFTECDLVRVRSKPHLVDEDFKLTELTEDWLQPINTSITLGKDLRSLTYADVGGDKKSQSDLQTTIHNIRAEYALGIAAAVAETERILSSLIEQTSESIKLEISEIYTTNDEVTNAISTSLTQLSDSFQFSFNQLQAVVDANGELVDDRFTELYNYIRFVNGSIVLGGSDSAITLTIENDMIVFKKNGVQFGWWDGVDFHTGNIVVEVNERAQLGNFAFVPRSNGSLSFLKVGG